MFFTLLRIYLPAEGTGRPGRPGGAARAAPPGGRRDQDGTFSLSACVRMRPRSTYKPLLLRGPVYSVCMWVYTVKIDWECKRKVSCETRRYAGEGNNSFEQKQGAPVSSLLIVKHVGGGGSCGCPTILANLIYVCLVIVYNTYTYIYFSAIITVFLVPFNYSL